MKSKGNQQNKKKTHRKGENIHKQRNLQRIHLQNIQTAHAAKVKTHTHTHTHQSKKWAEDLNRHFPKNNIDDQQVYEKMVNITNY